MVISELDDGIMATINIENPIPRTVELTNVDDAFRSRDGRNTMFYNVYQDTSIKFRKEYYRMQNS